MNPRTTGILALVALALGSFLYFYEIEGGEAREEAEAQSKRLFVGLDAATITAITLTTREGTEATLERGEGGFHLTAPVAFPADSFAADGLATNLAELASEAVLENPREPEEYGLADGARIVRFRAGDDEHVLRIGSKTPIGANSYASVEGRDTVVTVPTFATQTFDKALDDLREKRILDFDRDGIQRIVVRWPDAHVELERTPVQDAQDEAEAGDAKDPASAWRVVAPVEARADDEVVDQLLSDLSFLRADGFVDDSPGDAEAGLAPPAFEVELVDEVSEEGAEASVHRMAIGAPRDGGKRLVRGGQASLYTIPAARLADFPSTVVDYRFKRLSKYAMSDAVRVDFFFHPSAGDPVSVTAELGEDSWRSSPETVPSGKIAQLVSELSSLKASDILHESASEADLEALGLSPPRTIITVLGKAEASEGEEPAPAPRLTEIHLGEVKGSEWIIARAAGNPAVYRLDYELAEYLPVGLEAFRNRFVSLEPAVEAPTAGDEVIVAPDEESP